MQHYLNEFERQEHIILIAQYCLRIPPTPLQTKVNTGSILRPSLFIHLHYSSVHCISTPLLCQNWCTRCAQHCDFQLYLGMPLQHVNMFEVLIWLTFIISNVSDKHTTFICPRRWRLLDAEGEGTTLLRNISNQSPKHDSWQPDFFDMTKFTILIPSSLLSWCWLSFQCQFENILWHSLH